MDKYFATEDIVKLGASLMEKVEHYYEYLQTSGRLAIWKKSHEQYYAGLFKGGRLNKGGTQSEFTLLSINHYRNLLQHLKNMTTQQLPALNPRAANTDYESMAQTIVASGILDYYLNEKKMSDFADTCVDDCLVFGEGEVEQTWDTDAGEEYAADTTNNNKIYHQGDIVHRNYTPMDVIRDWTAPDPMHTTWKILRFFKSKNDLAVKYPGMADKILGLSMDSTKTYNVRLGHIGREDTDLIPVFRFYHKKTPAVPAGRMVEFVSADCWLSDGPLPYSDIPVYRMAPSEQRGTVFGYTVGYDLLPIQEAIDGLESTIVTNQQNYGVQNIWAPSGSGLSVQQLAGGLNLITSSVKPEGLNLVNTPAEIFKFIADLVQVMETISGVNSVARGNPEASLKSGAALALVQSMAIQFNSGLQKSYASLWSDLGSGIIDLLKRFPQTERNIVISGKNNRSYMATFTKDKLKNIKRVVVDLGNPLSRTTAGKVDMADNLLQRGLIKEPEQYIEVLTTGKLEPTFEGPQAEKMLIRAENEKLMEAQPVQATAIDPHSLHIQEHKVVIASPESRANASVVANTLTHIQEHINLLRTTDPALLQAIGQQPIAPLPVVIPGAAGALPSAASGPAPAPGQGSSKTSAAMTPGTPADAAAAKVKGPNMPNNALTGQKYNNVSGGL